MPDFNSAKSYRIDGYDHYETPEACLVEYGDKDPRLGEFDMAEAIREAGPVTVHAYAIAPRDVLNLDNMSDRIMTMFEEEFADANLRLLDDIDRLKSQAAYRDCKTAVWLALGSYQDSLPVTRLEDKPFASKSYSADEALAVLRELKPGWFREVSNG